MCVIIVVIGFVIRTTCSSLLLSSQRFDHYTIWPSYNPRMSAIIIPLFTVRGDNSYQPIKPTSLIYICVACSFLLSLLILNATRPGDWKLSKTARESVMFKRAILSITPRISWLHILFLSKWVFNTWFWYCWKIIWISSMKETNNSHRGE